jgi:Ca2+-transporting ATPase
MRSLSSRAMRLLAVAITDSPIDDNKKLPANLTLIGVLGMRDALRTTAYQSVQQAQTSRHSSRHDHRRRQRNRPSDCQ